MEKEDLYQAVISLILGMAMAYYWDADWQKHSSIAQAYEQLRDYCCSVNPFSAYQSRGDVSEGKILVHPPVFLDCSDFHK